MNAPISTFSQASVDLPWPQDGTDIEPSASVTTNHMPKPSSRSTSRKSRATRTSGKYEATYTQESLFSQADSPASHSVLPGSSEARTTTAISGRKCAESYARQGPLGSLVRMLLESSTWHSTRCVLTWRRKVTKSNRSLFQLAPSMRRTEGIGCGSSPDIWPTPAARDYKGGRKPETLRATGRGFSNSLNDALTVNGQHGSLNPTWVGALMGFPPGWTEIDA